MSRPPMKAVGQIRNYCEKTQCRRCIYGEIKDYGEVHGDYVGCKLQHNNPCDWEVDNSCSGEDDTQCGNRSRE